MGVRKVSNTGAARKVLPFDVVTVAETAGMIGKSRVQVWRLIRSGRLPAVMVGNVYLIRRSNVVRYLDWVERFAKVKSEPWGRRKRSDN